LYFFFGTTALCWIGHLIVEILRSSTVGHTTFGRTPLDERWAYRRGLFWQHITFTRDRYPWPLWDSNPQSEQAGGRRPTS